MLLRLCLISAGLWLCGQGGPTDLGLTSSSPLPTVTLINVSVKLTGTVVGVKINTDEGTTEYRIDELARLGGTTVRNVRAYQDRGLLPSVPSPRACGSVLRPPPGPPASHNPSARSRLHTLEHQ